VDEKICQILGSVPPAYLVAAYLGDKLIEAWLGKTERVKSGSVLELVFNLVRSLFGRK
jgi:hypothetical protein